MYDVSRNGVVFNVVEGDEKEVHFTSALRSGYPEVDSAKATLYEAPGAEAAIVVVHGIGKVKLSHLRFYPESMRREGLTAIMPVLPFHYERITEKNEYSDRFIKGPDEVMERKFCQAVVDILTCVDFLKSSGYKRIHIMGISSGGMIATIAMALDQRIEKGALVITGGNLEVITWKSIATSVYRVKKGREKREQYKKSLEIRRAFEECVRGFSSIDDLKDIPALFRYDPSLFAKLITPDRVLMFSAMIDPFIPRASSNDLWERLGNPKRYILPSGHLTAHLLFKRFIFKKSLEFYIE
jgi:dienelactone hydrolase